MPDYSRSVSPNSLPSIQMLDYSRQASGTRSPSFTASIHSQAMSLSSKAETRQCSGWEQIPIGTKSTQLPVVEEQNKEHPIRPSAAKEAREASYTGKQRVTSITARESPGVTVRSTSDSVIKHLQRMPSQPMQEAEDTSRNQNNLAKMPQMHEVRSKKEGRLSSIEIDVPMKHRQGLTRSSVGELDKENARSNEVFASSIGDSKRRRIDSQHVETKQSSPARRHGGNRVGSADGLTPEGVVRRDALDPLHDNIL